MTGSAKLERAEKAFVKQLEHARAASDDVQEADRVGNGERFCIEAFAIFRWGNRVELRNHYGYTIRKRTPNVQ